MLILWAQSVPKYSSTLNQPYDTHGNTVVKKAGISVHPWNIIDAIASSTQTPSERNFPTPSPSPRMLHLHPSMLLQGCPTNPLTQHPSPTLTLTLPQLQGCKPVQYQNVSWRIERQITTTGRNENPSTPPSPFLIPTPAPSSNTDNCVNTRSTPKHGPHRTPTNSAASAKVSGAAPKAPQTNESPAQTPFALSPIMPSL